MAKPSRGPFAKRQKELARQEKQKEKRARRLEAAGKQASGEPGSPDEDPDIAGIQLGPQPGADDVVEDDEDQAEDESPDRQE